MADNLDGIWRTVGGRRIFIKSGQKLSEAMKESGKFTNSIKNKAFEKQLGEDLYIINKEAKKYRDVVEYLEKTDLQKEKVSKRKQDEYNKIIEKIKNSKDYKETEIRYEKNPSGLFTKEEMLSKGITDNADIFQQELYDLKDKTIKKVLKEGKKIEGYHTFEYDDRNIDYNYIIIGDRDFHFNTSYDNSAKELYKNSKKIRLGYIKGKITSKSEIKYTEEQFNKSLIRIRNYTKD